MPQSKERHREYMRIRLRALMQIPEWKANRASKHCDYMKKRRAQRSEEWKLKHCARRRLRHSTKILDPDHRAKDAESKRRRREAERTREHKIRKYMSVILTERSLRKKQVVP